MTTEDNTTPEQPKEIVHGIIKGQTTSTGATMYEGLGNAHMSFNGIKYLEACNGDILIRGQHGLRDHIIPLRKAVGKYFEWMDLTYAYCRAGVQGWDEMMDIAKDLKARIFEAVAQRKQLQEPIPDDVSEFCKKYGEATK